MGRLGAVALAGLGRHHLGAIATVGGESAMLVGEVDARFWGRGGKRGDEVEVLADHIRGAVTMGTSELIAHLASRCERQAPLGDRGRTESPTQEPALGGGRALPRSKHPGISRIWWTPEIERLCRSYGGAHHEQTSKSFHP
jgi:hypothetical protein